MQPRVFHLTYLLFPTLSQNPTLLNEKIQFNLNLKILFSKAHLLLAKNNFIIQHCCTVTLFECLSLSYKAFFSSLCYADEKELSRNVFKTIFFSQKEICFRRKKNRAKCKKNVENKNMMKTKELEVDKIKIVN